ncbi:hypothetical protein RQP46_007896 [Phenoliferia psychrophenolica]
MSQPPLRIAIVGGGIAGLSAALGFVAAQKAGANISIKIYEGAPAFGEIGAGVSLGPNAQRALKLMGAGEALDRAAGEDLDDPGSWFDFHIAEASHAKAGEFICTSALRGHLFARLGLDLTTQIAKYSEWVAWRGLIPRKQFHEAMGPNARAKMMHCGTGRHILHFPVRSGELINIVAFVRDPEHLKLGHNTGPWTEERPHSEMLQDFASFTPECKALLQAIEKPSIWGIFALPPIHNIVDERCIIIGDAAFGGSGAGQAIEDALFISKFLSHDSVSSATPLERVSAINKALEAYALLRHPRGLDVQRTSKEAGLLYEFMGVNGEGSDMARLKEGLESRLVWIWEYDEEKVLQQELAKL